MQLVLPSREYEQSYREYILELGDEERYPFPLDFDHSNFEELLAKLDKFRKGKDLPDGYVPASTFWLVDRDEILGVSNLRHFLNERIRHAGGHIGLGVRPTRRGQGLGLHLLGLTLQQAYALGITEVHIHCHKVNAPSAKMILANGGHLESEIEDDGEIIQRYVVHAL